MSYLYRKGYKQGSLKKKAPTRSILQGSSCLGPSAGCTGLCSDPAREGPAHPARVGPTPWRRAGGSGWGGIGQPLLKASTLPGCSGTKSNSSPRNLCGVSWRFFARSLYPPARCRPQPRVQAAGCCPSSRAGSQLRDEAAHPGWRGTASLHLAEGFLTPDFPSTA